MSVETKEELEHKLHFCRRKVFFLSKNFNELEEQLKKVREEAEREIIEDKLWNIVKKKKEYENIIKEIELILEYPTESIETEFE